MRETVSRAFSAQTDIPIRILHMVEFMQLDLNKQHMMQYPITENQLRSRQMMGEKFEHMGMNYPEVPDSRYVAQPVIDFFFSWKKEMGSAKKPNAIVEVEGFCFCNFIF